MEFIRAMTNIYYYLFQTRLVQHDGNSILKRFPTISYIGGNNTGRCLQREAL